MSPLWEALLRLCVCFFVIQIATIPTFASAEVMDLSKYHLVFDENFSNLSVSAHGPGTRWIAHTPWHGDFGDAKFIDPEPNFPFNHSNGVFRIEMRKMPDGRWASGLLASIDETGKGFALQYGYFEMRAKLPAGPGVWPAFWLDSYVPLPSKDPSVEIDIIEQYGKWTSNYNSTLTVWPKDNTTKKESTMQINTVPDGSMSADFHTYGVEVNTEWTIFYFDRVEKWRIQTPPAHKHPLMILVDLGLGGGWPITETPDPSFMMIDYVRAYAPAPASPSAPPIKQP